MAVGKAKRLRVYERDGHQCVSCSRTDNLTIDHIWPKSLGGTDVEKNLQTLCRNCNTQKGSKVTVHSARVIHRRDCHPSWGCVYGCPVDAVLRSG